MLTNALYVPTCVLCAMDPAPLPRYDFDRWETFRDIITAVVAKQSANHMSPLFGKMLASGGQSLFPPTSVVPERERKSGKALARSMVPYSRLRYLQEDILQCGRTKLECVYAHVRPDSPPRWDPDERHYMVAAMFQPENAQNGFEPVSVPPYLAEGTRQIALPSPETMNDVINKECELRLLPETLATFRNSTMDADDAQLIEVIQRAAGASYGLGKEAPDLIRCAQQLYPGLKALKNAHYIKHNKITQGVLKQGDAIPSVKLHSIYNQGCSTVDLKDVAATLSSSSLTSSSTSSSSSSLLASLLPSSLRPPRSASTTPMPPPLRLPTMASTSSSGYERSDRPLVVAAGSYT